MNTLPLLFALLIYGSVDAKKLKGFNKGCLDAHNFYRSMHNLPPLKWDPKLAVTSKRWAREVMKRSPLNRRPKPSLQTPYWPHSEEDGYYREKYNIGENIAWDLATNGNPASYYVLLFYQEIFIFNPKNPRAHGVGHFTRMLDRDATHVGCGVAKKKIEMNPYWKPYSTRVVVQYRLDPRGRDHSVPEIREGSCITRKGKCTNKKYKENECLAFGPAGKCDCKRGRATCKSENGCIVQCRQQPPYNKYEWERWCRGKTSCKCDVDKGAVCD